MTKENKANPTDPPNLSFLFTQKGTPVYKYFLGLDDNYRKFAFSLFPVEKIKAEIVRLFKRALRLKSCYFDLSISNKENQKSHKQALVKKTLAKFFCLSKGRINKILR